MTDQDRSGSSPFSHSDQLLAKSAQLLRDSESLRQHCAKVREQMDEVTAALHELVGAHVKSPGAGVSKMKIIDGAYTAEVLLRRRKGMFSYYWIVQEPGSPQVLAIGSENTFSQCEQAARSCLAEMRAPG